MFVNKNENVDSWQITLIQKIKILEFSVNLLLLVVFRISFMMMKPLIGQQRAEHVGVQYFSGNKKIYEEFGQKSIIDLYCEKKVNGF